MDATEGTAQDRRRGLSRRDLLRGLAAASAATGAAALAARGGLAQDRAPATPGGQPSLPVAERVDVTLRSGFDPGAIGVLGPMPSKEQQAGDPWMQAYAETLQTWLDANPGVEIEQITLDSTGGEQEALLAAIAGGVAPSWYGGWQVGGTLSALNSAFKRGLAADITPLVERYGVSESITDVVRNLWAPYRVDGKVYSVPGDIVFSGTGIYYRRDLLTEAGLPEPTFAWTWSDVRALAKALTTGDRKGIALANSAIETVLNAEAFELMTQLPAPDQDWHWRWDYTTQAEKWAPIIQGFRDMMFVDQSVFADITIDSMGSTADAFARGDAAMVPAHSAFMNIPKPGDGIPGMPAAFGGTMDEIVGFVALPVGTNGHFGATQPFFTNFLYDPNLDEDALDKAVSAYAFMWYGQGFTQVRQRVWELTQDPALVYNAWAPVNGVTQIEGVPASVDDVWPRRFLESARQMLAIPLVPVEGAYIPAEGETGPSGIAWEDARSRWTFEPGDLDLAADLGELEENRNTEAAGFTSSVPTEEFVAGTKAFYEAHAAFWQQHAPAFYSAEFEPWYAAQVAPALG